MLKRTISILLAASMLIGLAGCGQKEETGTPQVVNDKGRYVEEAISLPEGIDGQDIFQISKKGDAMCIYVREDRDGDDGIACYLYQDGSFKKDTPAWLENMTLTDMQDFKVMEDVNGKSYLYCVILEGDNLLGHLYVSADGSQVEDITPEDWLTEDPEYHYYDYPQDIVILEDGSIAANFYYHAKIYDGENRAVINDFMFTGEYIQEIYADKDKFYLLPVNDNWEFQGIEVYRQGTDSPETTFTCDEKIGSSNFMDILSDGSLVVTGENGFFKQDAASGEWSKIVAGSYTSFALSSMWCMGFTALDSGIYYAMFAQESGERVLMEYVYDPEISLAPDTVLKVYSVYENPTIKQAAAMYSRLHPEVLVEVETGIPYEDEETADLNTVLQNLNTRLLAGEGADILVLDGLDTDSFIEKGLLADISDVVTPMSENGTILKNIADGYTDESGAVYMIPLRFSVNLLLGSRIDAKEAGTIEELAAVLGKQQESILGPMTASALTETFVPYMVSDIVEGKQLNKEVLADNLEYLKTIATNSGVVEKYTNDERKWSMWDIASSAGAAFCEAKGFLDAMFPVSAANLVKGSFSCFENAYKPIGQVGINSGTQNPEAAKDFLQYALSFEIQDSDFYDGFPINADALENQLKKDRSDYSAYTMIDIGGGQTAEFVIDPVSEKDGNALIEMCRKLDKKMVEDVQIESVITEALPAYLDGSASLEDTVSKIEKGLNMYLAE